MTTLASEGSARRIPPALFPVTVFASAALVFLVQPMVAKLVLPLLGGSPSVWNTSMAFFQIALLVGYGYAHLLQRLRAVRTQALVHCAMLAAAALALPLRVSSLAGQPSSTHPALWLLGVLALSIGTPFAVLSATAPLVQAWHAHTLGAAEGREPYALYAASNLGSLLALVAYPALVEPLSTLADQRHSWTAGYAAFGLLMVGLALAAARAGRGETATAVAVRQAGPPVRWRDRIAWIALAAIPCSLMLGVTSYITTDVASAPFLWVAPLALYLVTFIIAFQETPSVSRRTVLLLQAGVVATCAALLPYRSSAFLVQLVLHLAAFFLTALMCHQALVARRPDPARLTEFYLCMSLGGVLGGAFNAFLAPVIFDNVWEYPLVLALSCLARPWRQDNPPWAWIALTVGVACAAAVPVVTTIGASAAGGGATVFALPRRELFDWGVWLLLATAIVSAFLVRRNGLMVFAVIAMISVGAQAAADRTDTRQSWRSFFGVLRQSQTTVAALGGQVNMLAHGTTLHGAQAASPAFRCQPLVYYTPSSPIGQVIRALQMENPALRIGAVGLGTGSVAAYVRPTDHLTFFEIDPLVIRVASDPRHFSYTTQCAKGPVDYVVGDARLTVAKQPPDGFDILLIDAFSSDAVPAHLLTVEAVRGYLTRMKPDGVVILHLTNRNLDLEGPAQAVAAAAGGAALIQEYRPVGKGAGWESSEDALIIGRSPAALERFVGTPAWRPTDPHAVRPWTDDYTNLAGALWRRLQQKWAGERD